MSNDFVILTDFTKEIVEECEKSMNNKIKIITDEMVRTYELGKDRDKELSDKLTYIKNELDVKISDVNIEHLFEKMDDFCENIMTEKITDMIKLIECFREKDLNNIKEQMNDKMFTVVQRMEHLFEVDRTQIQFIIDKNLELEARIFALDEANKILKNQIENGNQETQKNMQMLINNDKNIKSVRGIKGDKAYDGAKG